MDKSIDLDFCIIPDPFSNGGKNMIFITKPGDNSLNKDVIDSEQYINIKEILEKFGYTETGSLQFESPNNKDFPKSTILEMKKFLDDFGLSYNRELEVNIIRDLSSLKNKTDKEHQNNLNLIYGDKNEEDYKSVNENTRNELVKSKKELFDFEYKEPNLKETVLLSLYLFLEFGFNQYGAPIIKFGGDFKDSEDYDDRNYIKIIESEFTRINDPNSPNSIVLESTKNQHDFLKEIGMFYSGFFKYQRRIEKGDSMILKETKYPYKLTDIKKHLDPDQSIIVETSRMGYDRLCKLSEKIRLESIKEGGVLISTKKIEHEAEGLSKFLSNKMEMFSQKEDFEGASKIKKEVKIIKEKLEFIKNLDKSNITTNEYFDLFSIF